jgi:xanthine dehydrogenase accessory factor
MSGWWTIALDHVAQDETSVLVTITAVEGSAPREAGTKMLVWGDGQFGTVGGGNLEFVIAQQARRMLAGGDAYRRQSYPLGPLLGQCCGGRVDILMERIDASCAAWLGEVARFDGFGRGYAIRSVFERGVLRKAVLGPSDRLGSPDVEFTDPAGQTVAPASVRSGVADVTITESVDPRPVLLMFGAGHVGRALAPIAAGLPLHTRWFDTRLEFGAVEGALQPVIIEDLVAQIERASAGSLFLIFTQSHDLDYALTHAAMTRADFLYCGLIGSATKRARFEKRLIADGIPHSMLRRLVCPIGAIGLASKEPAMLAIAIAAELMLTVEARADVRSPKAVHAR